MEEGSFDVEKLPSSGSRFEKLEVIHDGYDATIWKASDKEKDGLPVAIKIFRNIQAGEKECRILKMCQSSPLFPTFLGAYVDESRSQLWLVMEYLPFGTIGELARGFARKEKRLKEEHIAFMLREVLLALVELHSKGIAYRDLKASNVMLDSLGDVKLVDFGSSKILGDPGERISDLESSPHWTAPEVFKCLQHIFGDPNGSGRGKNEDRRSSTTSCVEGSYDVRADVWSLGILAIELADGVPPLSDVSPSRAMFQIVQSPPPRLHRETDWSEEFVDFISECLTCNPMYRPVMEELREHPFIAAVPERDIHLRSELKVLAQQNELENDERALEVKVCTDGRLRKRVDEDGEEVFPDDLVRVPELHEDAVLSILEKRYSRKMPNTFAGDVLIAINGFPESQNSGRYDPDRYILRALSDNEPHVMAIADKAWQEMLHHKLPQMILLSGESGSGKTGHFNALTHHLCRFGHGNRLLISKIQQLNCILNAFISAPTKINPSGSTRAIHLQELTFSKSGKVSGANNWVYGLDVNHLIPERFKRGDGTFLIFYYFYHGMAQMGNLEKYRLHQSACYRLLVPFSSHSDPAEHAAFFGIIQSAFKVLELGDLEVEHIHKGLAAIINLSQVVVESDREGKGVLRNQEFLNQAASLLEVDQERLASSITHVLDHSGVPQSRSMLAEAKNHLNSLITCLYQRLVDWIIHVFNTSFSLSRKVFGDDYSVGLLDHYGYEDFPGENGLSQLVVNTTNDFMQYYYDQQIFVKELGELDKEGVHVPGPLTYKDIRPGVDFVMHASKGLFKVIDNATVTGQPFEAIASLAQSTAEGLITIQRSRGTFQLLHANKPITYSNPAKFVQENNAHLFEQIAMVMTASSDKIVRSLFRAKIRLTGGLLVGDLMCQQGNHLTPTGFPSPPSLEVEEVAPTSKNMPTCLKKGFSQTKALLTRATMARAALLSLMKKMVVCAPLFIRCIRCSDEPWYAQQETNPKLNLDVVSRQLKQMGVMETIKLRQVGYSSRTPFDEFLRRYKFLVFDFEETVEENEENCRLLFLRLRIEDGWALGKTQVCARYHVEEFLARLYEKEVRKIIKIQAMVRRYLTRLKEKKMINDKKRKRRQRTKHHKFGEGVTEEEAAVKLQKAFRGFKVRKQLDPRKKLEKRTLVASPGGMQIDIALYWRKWRSRTIFQQLQRYRALNVEQLVYFSQQVHLYGQDVNASLRRWNDAVDLDKVESKNYLKPHDVLRCVSPRPAFSKLPLRLADVMYIETSHLRDPFCSRGLRTPTSPVRSPSPASTDVDDDAWDAPLRTAMRAPRDEIPTLRTVAHHEEWRDVMMMREERTSHSPNASYPNIDHHRTPTPSALAMSRLPSEGSPSYPHSPRVSPVQNGRTSNASTIPVNSRDSQNAPSPPPSELIKKFSQPVPKVTWRNQEERRGGPINKVPRPASWSQFRSPAAAVPGPECLNDMRNRLRKTALGEALKATGSFAPCGSRSENIIPGAVRRSSPTTESKVGVVKRPRSPAGSSASDTKDGTAEDAAGRVFDFQAMLRKTNLRSPLMMGTRADLDPPEAESDSGQSPGDLLWQELKDKLGGSGDDEEDERTHANDRFSDKVSSPTGFNIAVDRPESSSAVTSPTSNSAASSPSLVYQRLGAAAPDRRDSSTLAQHMKNLATTAKNHACHFLDHRAGEPPQTEEGRTPTPQPGTNRRTPTPTLIYQPSSVEELDDEGVEDGQALVPARIIFNDQEEVVL